MKRQALLASIFAIAGILSIPTTAYPYNFDVIVRESNGTPMSSLTVSVYQDSTGASPYSLVISSSLDSNGQTHIGAAGGPGACIQFLKPGWRFENRDFGGQDGAPPGSICGNLDFFSPLPVTGYRLHSGAAVSVIGGANGYVNPNAGEVATIVVQRLSLPTTVTVRIYTMSGKLVMSKTQVMAATVENAVTWDCKDSENNPVSTGIYVAHIRGSDVNERTQIAKVKIAVVRK